jgi:predicted transcriptional regulator
LLIGVSTETNERRRAFFLLLFGGSRGYVCIAHKPAQKKGMVEEYFKYPEELEPMLEHINRTYLGNDIYYCPMLFTKKSRRKDDVSVCTAAWADLDTCHPDKMLVEPSLTLETSPDRYQALWVFESPQYPEEAEELSRRIAYRHADEGADRSGWDLTQLLRVPLTYNYKYQTAMTPEVPSVDILALKRLRYRLSDFQDYPQAAGFEFLDIPFPDELPTESGNEILQRFRQRINPMVWELYKEEPEEHKWSTRLWSLLMLLFENGMTREEVYVVASSAACNKWKRDGRPKALWSDVCRAFNQNERNIQVVLPAGVASKELLTDQEKRDIEATPSFIERYIEWARGLGDAAFQYHQAGAFICLSSLLSGPVRLPTSYGVIIPNLWFMILADTTLTRKTTAMDIAMDLVTEIDSDAVLATDGSIEGLLTGLSTRPGRPSIFLRDEFSGLLESMTKKDYMAGMPELFTKLYDGKMMKRMLRKEVIEVREPVLIMFAGGIKNKITSLLSFEHVSSGFMPRFIFITAESDPTKLKPLGPPTAHNLGNRDAIKNELLDLRTHYGGIALAPQLAAIMTEGLKIGVTNQQFLAELTADAWVRYNQLEAAMVQAGLDSNRQDIMTPVHDRLSKSMLKAAILIAASRQRDEKVIVEEQDIVRAIYYGEQWRLHVADVMENVGKGTNERMLDNILRAIQKRDGTTKSVIMQNYHLSARDMSAHLETLEQRGLITRSRTGRTEKLFAVTRGSV